MSVPSGGTADLAVIYNLCYYLILSFKGPSPCKANTILPSDLFTQHNCTRACSEAWPNGAEIMCVKCSLLPPPPPPALPSQWVLFWSRHWPHSPGPLKRSKLQMIQKDFYSDLPRLLDRAGAPTYKNSKKTLMHASLTENKWKMSHSMVDYTHYAFLILPLPRAFCSVPVQICSRCTDDPPPLPVLPPDYPCFSGSLSLFLSNCLTPKSGSDAKNASTYCKYTKDSSCLQRHKATQTRRVCPWAQMYK